MVTPKPAESPSADPAVVAALKPRASAWFETLRDRICAAFEAAYVKYVKRICHGCFLAPSASIS